MADWTLPINTTLYLDILNLLKGRDVDAVTLCASVPTTPPTGAIRYVRLTNKFQEWNGSAWEDKIISLASGGTGGSSASAARAALGLGSLAVQEDSNVNITGGNINGVTMSASVLTAGQVALARGGTGASLALGAAGTVIQSNGTDVVFGTDGSALTGLNASNIAAGILALARLAGITTTQMASANISQFTNDAGYVTAATAALPIGAMVDYAGSIIPSPWLSCNGAAISRVTYAALFAVIGTTFGAGDGSTTFNLPDYRDRSSCGASATNPVGSSLGSLNHTHAPGTLVNDTHTGHTHPTTGTSGAGSAHSHSMSGNTGSGSPHTHSSESVAPPNHSHSYTTDATDVGDSTMAVDEGDGTNGTVNPIGALSNSSHTHTGTTTGVDTNQAHSHTNGSESSHTHGGGTLTAANESAHTHSSGSITAASGGSHSHVMSGASGAANHAVLFATMIIKYA